MTTVIVPVSGNGFVVTQECNKSTDAIVGDRAITEWTNEDALIRIYVDVTEPTEVDVALVMYIIDGAKSTIRVSCGEQVQEVDVTDDIKESVPIGKFNIEAPGYVHFDIQGISKDGEYFGEIESLECSNYKGEIKISTDGRRNGPAVHMWYSLDGIENGEYFYNEVEVLSSCDQVVCAYYMVCGFTGGYFGIQHNGPTERRVLFSIWSPYDSNDPSQVPAEYDVETLKSGPDVVVEPFGNEGVGQHSYILYNWKAGVPIKCLLRVNPDESNNWTDYTAWFADSSDGIWRLLGSFRRPKIITHVAGPYSFCENYSGEYGCYERKAYYGPQWVRDTKGEWHELRHGTFTTDDSGESGSRVDYCGGVEGSRFFLRNCGFFHDNVEIGSNFTRESAGQAPDVDVDNLP